MRCGMCAIACTGARYHMPIAYEGALKLKEISYIMPKATRRGNETRPDRPDRQAHAGGVYCPQRPWHEKMISQIQQPRRVAHGHCRGDRGDDLVASMADHVCGTGLSLDALTVVTVIPLQILAYQIATLRGLDVDQPAICQERDSRIVG